MTSQETKKNVERFNEDVNANSGYLYTTNAQYSAVVANLRMSQAIEAVVPKHSKRIIDIGCGDGVYTDGLAQSFPGRYIEGHDPAHKAIDIATERFPSITFKVANILDQNDIPMTAFDVAVMRGVIHHLPDDSQTTAIRNARSYANTLIILEPNGNNPLLKIIEKRSAYHIAHEEQSFSSTLLTSWCKEAGWSSVTVHYIGFVPFFFPEIFARFIYFLQPLLERIPVLNKYFSSQILLTCRS